MVEDLNTLKEEEEAEEEWGTRTPAPRGFVCERREKLSASGLVERGTCMRDLLSIILLNRCR